MSDLGTMPRVLLIALTAMAAGGCATTPQAGRMAERADTVARLSPEHRAAVSRGQIDRGHSLEMVYIALGRPDTIAASADGNECCWTYRNFYLSAQVDDTPLYAARSRLQPGTAAGRVLGSQSPAFTGPRSAGMRSDPVGATPAPTRPAGVGGEPDVPPVTLAVTFVAGQVARIDFDPPEA